MRTKVCLLFALAAVLRGETHLFVNPDLIRSQKGVRQTVHPGRKLGQPVIRADRPWEGDRVYTYGTVRYDPEQRQFRMWYMSRADAKAQAEAPDLPLQHGDLVNYATSPDGIRWTKPDLGIYRFGGTAANNIVYGLHSPSLIFTPSDPVAPYRMLGMGWRPGTSGYWAAHSKDGLHWSDYPKNPVIESNDTITVTRDASTGEFMAFHKRMAPVRGFSRRTVWLSTSRDFQNWSPPVMVLAPDEEDDRWTKEPRQRTEFYVMSAFPHAGQYLGLLSVFRVTAERSSSERSRLVDISPVDGPVEIQLAYSANGREWRRLNQRVPVIPVGAPGSFDAGCILGVSNPVFHNDEIWVYYTAITTTHGGAPPDKKISIGRASWRRDGFVSMDAEATEEGMIETVPVTLGGSAIVVNAEASGGGIVAEIVDESGRVVAGFSRRDAVAVKGDGVRQTLRWRSKRELPAHGSVRFFMKSARLYSFSSGPL